jgi:general secretion pathway protein A
MYESHFGFTGQPFQLNPDPSFFFNSRGHGRALSYLEYGVAQAEGFIVITGEVGAGKTTLVRMLLDGLDRQKVLPAQIVSTQLQAGELLQSIITGFGIPAQGNSKAHLIATLEAFLTALAAQGRHALLIVDEAQNLAPVVIEELRMLSNFQLGNKALLQSFLVGQPQLRRSLESPDMEQLRQRVMASYHLGPLSVDETRGYVEHRLRHVGWDGVRPHFDALAFDHLYRWTGGVPRRLNRLCNRALLAAFLDGMDRVTVDLVERVAFELRSEIGESDFEPLPLPDRSAAEAEAAVIAAVEAAPPTLAALQEVPVPAAAVLPAAEDGVAAVPDVETAHQPLDAEAAEADAMPSLDAGPLVEEVVESLLSAARHSPLALLDVVRAEAVLPRSAAHKRDVVLCVATCESHALRFAALAKSFVDAGDALRFVLVNPGSQTDVWPWPRMDRLLPALETGLHLGIPDAGFETMASPLLERFGHVMQEFQPVAVLVLGASDAAGLCALLAHKRGVPLIHVGGGLEQVRPATGRDTDLATRLADLLLVRQDRATLSAHRRDGAAVDRIGIVNGDLRVDGLRSVWREVSSAYGAFLRHAMPIYLGPTWSEHAGAGTPYGLVSVSLAGCGDDEVSLRVRQILELASLFAEMPAQGASVRPKLVWLVNTPTQDRLSSLLATQATLNEQICQVLGEGPRSGALRAKMDAALILCREVDSLPDQLSLLQGASWALLQPGQVLGDAAQLLDVPALLLSPDTPDWLEVLAPAGAADAAVRRTQHRLTPPGSGLLPWMVAASAQSHREQPNEADCAAAAIRRRLLEFLAERPAQPAASVMVPSDVSLPVAV